MTIAAQPKKRVVIVGGGPVGLVSALNLALHEVPVLVLEAHSELFLDLRAGSFHPPTLEVLDPIGVTAKLHDIGIVVPAWQLRDRTDGVVGLFDLSSLLKDETPFPYRLHVEQHKLTPLVYKMLMRMPHVDVRFSSRVTEVSQDGDHVTVKAEMPNGNRYIFRRLGCRRRRRRQHSAEISGHPLRGFHLSGKIRFDQHAVRSRKTRIYRYRLHLASGRMVRGFSSAPFGATRFVEVFVWLPSRRKRRGSAER